MFHNFKDFRMQMNTPPPPLQPIIAEAKNGLYHYFGQQNQQHQTSLPPPPMTNAYSTNVTNTSSQYINVNIVQSNNPNELKLMPNLTQIGSNIQNKLSQQHQQIQTSKETIVNASVNGSSYMNNCSPFLTPHNQLVSSSVDSKLSFNGTEGLLNSSSDDMAFEDDDRMSQCSIQEKGQCKLLENKEDFCCL